MEDDIEKIRYLIEEWLEQETPELIERSFPYDYKKSNLIISLVGVRRAGKTYLLFQIAKQLRVSIPRQNIIYLNFEDNRLFPLKGDELSSLIETYIENFTPASRAPIYFLLDEIQNIPDWERSLRRIYDQKKVKLLITGSSSKLLSSEIATSLRGRTLSHLVFPFSYREFLKAKGIKIEDTPKLEYSTRRHSLLRQFQDYLRFGGFPQVVFEDAKDELLREYYQAIFYRDIVERFNIRKLSLFEAFLKILMENNASLFSISKMADYLRTIGFKVNKSTLSEYIFYARSAFLIFDVSIFSYKVKDRLQYPRKIYAIDPGLVNAITFRASHNYGKMLENVIFLELMRRRKEVYYWKSGRNYEVDFVVKEGLKVVELIQVVWKVADAQTRKREERALLLAMEEFGLKKALVLTRDEKREVKIDKKQIHYLPAWLWLLDEKYK